MRVWWWPLQRGAVMNVGSGVEEPRTGRRMRMKMTLGVLVRREDKDDT
jgi:hypothetical protein